MPKSIDHIVIAVSDLAQSSEDYASAGFTVIQGGEHVGGATHNALVSFVDGTYFELIAIKDESKLGDLRWFEALKHGDSSVAFALHSDDLATEAKRLNETGLSANGPHDGGRFRLDGQKVDWRIVQLQGESGAPLPFLIEDVTPRVLRVPEGSATRHPLGDLRVAGVTIVTGNLAASAVSFGELLGAGEDSTGTGIPGVGATKRFTIGQQWIDLAQPTDGESEIGAFQQTRGDGIYQIVLAGGGSAAGALPTPLTHGVLITVEP